MTGWTPKPRVGVGADWLPSIVNDAWDAAQSGAQSALGAVQQGWDTLQNLPAGPSFADAVAPAARFVDVDPESAARMMQAMPIAGMETGAAKSAAAPAMTQVERASDGRITRWMDDAGQWFLRLYHGTSGDFKSVSPKKLAVSDNLFGPAHYMTDDPRVAGGIVRSTGDGGFQTAPKGYAQAKINPEEAENDVPWLAERVQNIKDSIKAAEAEWGSSSSDIRYLREDLRSAKEELADSIKQLNPKSGPNVRVTDVPDNLNLLDVDAPVPPDFMHKFVDGLSVNLAYTPVRTGEDLYKLLVDRLWGSVRGDSALAKNNAAKAAANKLLQSWGYDGIRYAGGRRIPMKDYDTQKMIEHNAYAIFPESLSKIRNALSGRVGGAWIPPVVGGGLGAAAWLSREHDTGQGQAVGAGADTWGFGSGLDTPFGQISMPSLGGGLPDLAAGLTGGLSNALAPMWTPPAPPAIAPVEQPGQTRPAGAGLTAPGQTLPQSGFGPLQPANPAPQVQPIYPKTDELNVAYHAQRAANITEGGQAAPPFANELEGDLTTGWEEFGNAHLDALFSAVGLDGATAAACGPIAIAGLLRAFGVDTDPAKIAKRGLDKGQWNPGLGMLAGDGTSVADLLKSYGVENVNLPANSDSTSKIAALVERGVPVILNGPQHYLLAQDYDDNTGKFFVGSTGSNALDGGSDWMTLQEMGQHPGVGGPIESFIAPTRIPESVVGANSKQRFTTTSASVNPGADQVRQYIVHAAQSRGIDPNVALRIAEHEGGFEPAKRGTFSTGSSWWPFQLHYGGPGYETYGTTAGMGNSFTAETGWEPGDPRAWRASIDYALDAAARSGSWAAWYGRGPAGVGVNEGFS